MRASHAVEFPEFEVPENGSVVVKTQRTITTVVGDYVETEVSTRLVVYKDGVEAGGLSACGGEVSEYVNG
jgi:hypothetical protein